jgi:hypothetical protein
MAEKPAAKKQSTRLVGMDAIEDYAERNRKTIKKWIVEDHFPAVLVDGRWESNTELIDQYFRRKIEAVLPQGTPCLQ